MGKAPGNVKRKGKAGEAATYISRTKAVKKLQVSLSQFRQLCILKGIYPREPQSRKKAQQGNTQVKTLYYKKDIRFLLHEPILWKIRAYKAYLKKLKKALDKSDKLKVKRLQDTKPIYTLDHIIKERYPTFIDAVADLEDPLCMCFMYSHFPKSIRQHYNIVGLAHRLTVEFMNYVIHTKALRKVFVSIKGYYYQAEILGQTVTWLVAHPFGFDMPEDVDFNVMVIFTELYSTLLGFINFRLYNLADLHYPPRLKESQSYDSTGLDKGEVHLDRLSALNGDLLTVKPTVVEEPEEETDQFTFSDEPADIEAARKEQDSVVRLQKLFSGLKFFLGRECPRESLSFVIRCCGGCVSWDQSVYINSTYKESDETITHQITDRPQSNNQYLSRYYIQPQWVYDSINARRLLPVDSYFPGAVLPPHLSPFEGKPGGYKPPEELALDKFKDGEKLSSKPDQPTAEEKALSQLNNNTVTSKAKSSPGEVNKQNKPGKNKKGKNNKDKPQRIKGTKVPIMEEKRLEEYWATESKKPDETLTKEEVLAKMKVNPGKLQTKVTGKAEDRNYREMQEMMIKKKYKRMYTKMMQKRLQEKLELSKMRGRRKRIDAKNKIKKHVTELTTQ